MEQKEENMSEQLDDLAEVTTDASADVENGSSKGLTVVVAVVVVVIVLGALYWWGTQLEAPTVEEFAPQATEPAPASPTDGTTDVESEADVNVETVDPVAAPVDLEEVDGDVMEFDVDDAPTS